MDEADDRPSPGPDKRYGSLSEHAAVDIPWRSSRMVDDVRRDDVLTFAVAAERLANLARVDLETARGWLFYRCDRWHFVIYDRPPPGLPSAPGLRFQAGISAVMERPFLLLREEVDAAVPFLRNEVCGGEPTSPKQSEPPQPRGLRRHDQPLLQEMHEAIRDGKAGNPWAATALVVDRAKGAGTEKSKRERLRIRYVQTFQKCPAGK